MMNKKGVLHLMHNEKFSSQIITNFSLLDINNYFLISDGKNLSLTDNEGKYDILEFDIDRFVKENSISGIIVHGLNHHYAKFINDLKTAVKIAWVEWGFDIYHRPEVRKYLYGPETSKIVPKESNMKKWLKSNTLINKTYYSFTKKIDYDSLTNKAFKKIDYFCSFIYEDFLFLDNHFTHNTTFFYYVFSTIEQYLGANESLRINDDAKNIIIGNSNTFENNHLDVFKLLKDKMDIDNVSIIVPLSYGDDFKYKEKVIKSGEKYFNSNFYPLLDFMPRDEYFELLSNSSTAIFYHYRQQAMGNIIALLYMGARVYFSRKSPVYAYCKRVGLNIYNFDSEFNIYKNSVLEKEKADENRYILFKIFNQEQVIETINSLVDEF